MLPASGLRTAHRHGSDTLLHDTGHRAGDELCRVAARGEYRLIVHNWAGIAADGSATVTFFNAAGQAGTG